ncbi:hypothetical protein PACILC2_35500 [Paenibacillus cisolokensis]|uniref:Uncharacterized protein n=1 Tax=Paenibacillus cisolokensis TaxID=1658519 RepID=A0ABQ4N9S7_9BACL|nr:hypothetical protein PACILC2_35500 [Paenibacillus cisolokensis]
MAAASRWTAAAGDALCADASEGGEVRSLVAVSHSGWPTSPRKKSPILKRKLDELNAITRYA